jgi:hypothetical protein
LSLESGSKRAEIDASHQIPAMLIFNFCDLSPPLHNDIKYVFEFVEPILATLNAEKNLLKRWRIFTLYCDDWFNKERDDSINNSLNTTDFIPGP